MIDADHLQSRYPRLGNGLARIPLADLPTPVRQVRFLGSARGATVWIKEDNLTSRLFGGNKVRKLEYLFGRLGKRPVDRVATFGAVASNHALATALYARELGYRPVCFLSHQSRTPLAAAALNMHLQNATGLVPLHGDYGARLATLRAHLRGQRCGVIPMGGSSWTGTAGLVAAALELVGQADAGQLPLPDRVYVATGTMGTAAGLALGFALADRATEVHAVRVSHTAICNEPGLHRLMNKTVRMLHRLDASFPEDLAERSRVTLRHEYFEPGYARSNAKTDAAIAAAADQAGLRLESTYTGKAMAALLDDLPGCTARGERLVFWNSYHTTPLPVDSDRPVDRGALPAEFLRYFGQ
jgi:D-cysteine desulfhydrase